MDKSIINDLAEEEVRIANDRWRIWGSLFKHLIVPKQKDLPSALKLYETLSDEQIERRYGIHYWEDTAWKVYDSLRYHSVEIFIKSIEPRRLAELETKNVDLLLKKANFN